MNFSLAGDDGRSAAGSLLQQSNVLLQPLDVRNQTDNRTPDTPQPENRVLPFELGQTPGEKPEPIANTCLVVVLAENSHRSRGFNTVQAHEYGTVLQGDFPGHPLLQFASRH